MWTGPREKKKKIVTLFSKWSEIKHGVTQGSILRPLLFLSYKNDLPKLINNEPIPMLFADDINVLITHPNLVDFNTNFVKVSEISNR
jgi:hypothetical protein